MSVLYRFWVIIAYFPKFENVMRRRPRPLKGQSVIPMLKHHMANQCTKFEVSSFCRSGDILGGSKKLHGSRDHNHAPFGKWFFICLVRLDTAYMYTKFDSSSLSRSLDMDGGSNIYKTLCYGRGTAQRAFHYRKKSSNRWMTMTYTQGHHSCCY